MSKHGFAALFFVTVTDEANEHECCPDYDDLGAYTAVNLIPGSYSVNASRSGFKPVFRNFVFQVGQRARLDIRLEVGNIEQTVEVSGTIPLLQTENASVGQVWFAQIPSVAKRSPFPSDIRGAARREPALTWRSNMRTSCVGGCLPEPWLGVAPECQALKRNGSPAIVMANPLTEYTLQVAFA